MKKLIRHFIFIAFTIGLLFTSCVSGKKFAASEAQINKLQADNAKTLGLLNDCNLQAMKAREEKAALQKDYESIQKENVLTQNDLMVLSNESKLTIRDQAIRLKRLHDIIDKQREVADGLKISISNALLNYKADELSVYLKDGNVHVSLAEKLLFKSGSDVVDPKGKAALKSLADVLNSSEDFTVAIEGHTDNVPIKTKVFEDNWDLSTARAASIVRILTIDNGFDSARITASGKGQFHPIGENTTADGRAANRRTEVILSPNLQEIYKLLYQ